MSIESVFHRLAEKAGFSTRTDEYNGYEKYISKFVVQYIGISSISLDKNKWHIFFGIGVNIDPALSYFFGKKYKSKSKKYFSGYFVHIYSMELTSEGEVRSQGYPEYRAYLDVEEREFEMDFLSKIIPWMEERKKPEVLLNILKNGESFIIKDKNKWRQRLSFLGVRNRDKIISNVFLGNGLDKNCVMGALLLELGQEDAARELIVNEPNMRTFKIDFD
jgi:hypothetical protein